MTQTFTRQHHPAELVANRASADAIGMNSSSPEWMHECEIRKLAMLDLLEFESFLKGATKHRGADVAMAIESEVATRRIAMELMHIDHPYIDMRIYAQSGLEKIEPVNSGHKEDEHVAILIEDEQETTELSIEQNDPELAAPVKRGLFHR